MISILQARKTFNKGRKVTYRGFNREYLKNADLFLTGNVADSSSSIEVETLDGTREWVGHRALDFYSPLTFRTNVLAARGSDTYSTAIEELEKRKSALQEELTKITSAIEALKGL